MRLVMKKSHMQDPFYNPAQFSGSDYHSRKTGVDAHGNKTYRYVYGKASKGWQSIPNDKGSFEIGNEKTGSTIHIDAVQTEGSTRVIGTLRNKDGEVLSRITKEFSQGDAYFDSYRKWNPNRSRLITGVVKELQLGDRPIKSMRDIERAFQDTGMFPEDADKMKQASLVKSLNAIQDMRDFLMYSGVTERTRTQMVRRAKEIFGVMPDKERMKAMPYMFDIIKYDYQ